MLQKFVVTFDRHNKVYRPGDKVTGQLIVELLKPQFTRVLKVRCHGEAIVMWSNNATTQRKGGSSISVKDTGREEDTAKYTNSEVYFDLEKVILGDKKSKTHLTIQPGTHKYPFDFTLPHGIPSSYTGVYGTVRYQVEAIMRGQWWKNRHAKSNFVVNADLDLSMFPESSEKEELKKSKYICCICCKNGPISFHLKLPKKGYIIGETLNAVFEITNDSNRVIPCIIFRLQETTTYYSKDGEKKFTGKIITEMDVDGPAYKERVRLWQQDLFQVPSVPPTLLGGCGIIEVQYLIGIELQILGAVNLSGSIPIIIGTTN